MSELVADSNLREAGRLIGRGREAVRRFVGGDIETPHDRTREAMARLYLQRHGEGVLTAAERPQLERTTTPLKLLLPQGVEKATAEIRALFDVFRNPPELQPEMPESTLAIETWLLKRVKEEYAAEVPYPRPRKRAPRKKAEENGAEA